MKHSATILLFVAAAFWSSASARPRNREQQGVIDAATRWAIAEMEQLPEPHKTKLTKKLHEAQHRHWDNLMEYANYVQSMLDRYVRESAKGLYTLVLYSMAPPAHRKALEEKYTKTLKKAYDNLDDFIVEDNQIFKEVTGQDVGKVMAEIEADEGKLTAFGNDFEAHLNRVFAVGKKTNLSEKE